MFNHPALPDPAPNTKKNKDHIAVLFSGGIDSSYVLADLIRRGKTVYPIAFDDGTLNFQLRRSVALELTTQQLGVYNRLIVARLPEVEILRKSTSGYGFIPGLKLFMLITALSYCHVLNIRTLATGYNRNNDIDVFQDETQDFMNKTAELFYEGYGKETNTDFPFNGKIEITSPLLKMNKTEIVECARGIGLDMSTTISCRHIEVGAGLIHCGECQVCLNRRKAFLESYIPDPTRWVNGSTAANMSLATVSYWCK